MNGKQTQLTPRLWRWLSALLILAGLGLGADVAVTLLWQEPVSAVVALARRAEVPQRFTHAVPLSRADRAQLASMRQLDSRLAFLAARENAAAPAGAALGTLSIPALKLRYQLIQGASAASLQLGPAHYRQTGLPGQPGTVAIAGHRTTYLAPFRNINELKAGERISVAMPYGTFTYAVQKLEVVKPDAWWITRDVGYQRLVLSSCNPLFSAAQRIAVFATLTGVTPAGATRRVE